MGTVITDTLITLDNLSTIKVDNIKNNFLDNIMIQNENGVIENNEEIYEEIYEQVKIIRESFLNNSLKTLTQDSKDIIDFTLDNTNFIKYENENNFYLTNLASNDLKKYVFLCDIMADYYETKENNVNNDDYNYKHKLKFECGKALEECGDILVLNTPEDINYKYNNAISNIEPYSESFKYLFNDIIILNSNNFDTKVYGKFHYKYKKNEFRFYTALINYNILLAYYYYINKGSNEYPNINDKPETKNKIINQITDKIISFKSLFKHYRRILQKANTIATTTNIDKGLSESQKINNFNEINEELIEINRKIENKRDKDMMYKDNVNININDKIKTITIFVYYTIITFFLLNVILFNYYSEKTNKFLSIVITIFLIFIYFVLKLFKNDYYEYFDDSQELPTDDPTNYFIDFISPESSYNLLTANMSQDFQINFDSITNNDDTVIPMSNINQIFSIFGCDDSNTDCPQTKIEELFRALSNGNVTDSALLSSIQSSAGNISELLLEIQSIQGQIDTTKQLINQYTNEGGILQQLDESLAGALANSEELDILNNKLDLLHQDLDKKNNLIKDELNRLKGLIIDVQGMIVSNTTVVKEKIREKNLKEEEKGKLDLDIKRIKNQMIELDNINKVLENATAFIEHNIVEINRKIIISLNNLLTFKTEFNEKSKMIATWYENRTAGTLEEQEAAAKIIENYNRKKNEFDREKLRIEGLIRTNNEQVDKIRKKIENIAQVSNIKTYVYEAKFINIINYNLNNEEDKEKFRAVMETDISELLNIFPTRVIITDINTYLDTNYINFKLRILPSPSYLKLEEHIKKIITLQKNLQSLVNDSNTESQLEKNNILKTTYAKYIVFLKLDSTHGKNDKPRYIVPDSTDKYITLDDVLINYIDSNIPNYYDKLEVLKTEIKENKIGIISNNIKEIKEIINDINSSLVIEYNESPDYRTYYEEVHPNLEKELKKYQNIDNNNKLYDHIIESKLNTTEHDLLYLNALNKFFIHLSIYLGIFYIYASHFNYFGYTINFFITTVVVLILLYYLFKDLHKKVRRDSSKSYWKDSKKYFDE